MSRALHLVLGLALGVLAGLAGLILETPLHREGEWPFRGRYMSAVVWTLPPHLPSSPDDLRAGVEDRLPGFTASLQEYAEGTMLFVGSETVAPDVHAVANAIGRDLVGPEDLGRGVWGESAPDWFTGERRTHDLMWLAGGLAVGLLAVWLLRRARDRLSRRPPDPYRRERDEATPS